MRELASAKLAAGQQWELEVWASAMAWDWDVDDIDLMTMTGSCGSL